MLGASYIISIHIIINVVIFRKTHQNSPKPTKTHQNPPKPNETLQNSLKLTKTHQNSPKLTKTHQNSPKPTKTHQNLPKPTKTQNNSLLRLLIMGNYEYIYYQFTLNPQTSTLKFNGLVNVINKLTKFNKFE